MPASRPGSPPAQIGWIAAQLAIMEKYNVLQPVMTGFELAVLLLAIWDNRDRPLVDPSST